MRQWVLSVPFAIRFLFAAHLQAMSKALAIVYRAIETHLIHKAGLTRARARTGEFSPHNGDRAMYGFFIRLDATFGDAIARVTEALKQEGFGILTEIDVKATMKAKLGIDKRPYTILGACNPPLAHQALEADPDIGLLLPCNVVVREEADGGVSVGFMDPEAVLSLVQRPEVATLAKEVRTRLERVRDALEKSQAA